MSLPTPAELFERQIADMQSSNRDEILDALSQTIEDPYWLIDYYQKAGWDYPSFVSHCATMLEMATERRDDFSP